MFVLSGACGRPSIARLQAWAISHLQSCIACGGGSNCTFAHALLFTLRQPLVQLLPGHYQASGGKRRYGDWSGWRSVELLPPPCACRLYAENSRTLRALLSGCCELHAGRADCRRHWDYAHDEHATLVYTTPATTGSASFLWCAQQCRACLQGGSAGNGLDAATAAAACGLQQAPG